LDIFEYYKILETVVRIYRSMHKTRLSLKIGSTSFPDKNSARAPAYRKFLADKIADFGIVATENMNGMITSVA